jgi:hypothetical protein
VQKLRVAAHNVMLTERCYQWNVFMFHQELKHTRHQASTDTPIVMVAKIASANDCFGSVLFSERPHVFEFVQQRAEVISVIAVLRRCR